MLHIKLKEIKRRVKCEHKLCRDTPMCGQQPLAYLENCHVAYQIIGHEMFGNKQTQNRPLCRSLTP